MNSGLWSDEERGLSIIPRIEAIGPRECFGLLQGVEWEICSGEHMELKACANWQCWWKERLWLLESCWLPLFIHHCNCLITVSSRDKRRGVMPSRLPRSPCASVSRACCSSHTVSPDHFSMSKSFFYWKWGRYWVVSSWSGSSSCPSRQDFWRQLSLLCFPDELLLIFSLGGGVLSSCN